MGDIDDLLFRIERVGAVFYREGEILEKPEIMNYFFEKACFDLEKRGETRNGEQIKDMMKKDLGDLLVFACCVRQNMPEHYATYELARIEDIPFLE